MKRILKNNRSQQEILGFVMIIMIVVVVAVIFLGISLRKADKDLISTEDLEISNFLQSSLGYTSDCIVKEPFYGEIEDIIQGCYEGKSCTDGRSACDLINKTYSEMMDIFWPTGENRPIKYSEIEIYYAEQAEEGESEGIMGSRMMYFEKGDQSLCNIRRAGRELIYQYPGNIIVELTICR